MFLYNILNTIRKFYDSNQNVKKRQTSMLAVFFLSFDNNFLFTITTSELNNVLIVLGFGRFFIKYLISK